MVIILVDDSVLIGSDEFLEVEGARRSYLHVSLASV